MTAMSQNEFCMLELFLKLKLTISVAKEVCTKVIDRSISIVTFVLIVFY